jgi:hypothetical protein
MKAWHYTTGEKFPLIIESGLIIPATTGVKPPERPIVWFSLDQYFEMTARKGLANETGFLRTATIQETRELAGGLVRFGVDAERLIPWKGGELRKAAKMSYAIAKKLDAIGWKQGASPFEWLGSLEPVRVDECVIQIMDKKCKDGLWLDAHSQELFQRKAV